MRPVQQRAFTGSVRFPCCHWVPPAQLNGATNRLLEQWWEQYCPHCGRRWRFVRRSLVLMSPIEVAEFLAVMKDRTQPIDTWKVMLEIGRNVQIDYRQPKSSRPA